MTAIRESIVPVETITDDCHITCTDSRVIVIPAGDIELSPDQADAMAAMLSEFASHVRRGTP